MKTLNKTEELNVLPGQRNVRSASPPANHVDQVINFLIDFIRLRHGFPQQFSKPPPDAKDLLFDRAFGQTKRR